MRPDQLSNPISTDALRLRAPPQELIALIPRKTSRQTLQSFVREEGIDSIEEFLDVVTEVFAGRAFRKLRQDVETAFSKWLRAKVQTPAEPKAQRKQGFARPASAGRARRDPKVRLAALQKRFPYIGTVELPQFFSGATDEDNVDPRPLEALVSEASRPGGLTVQTRKNVERVLEFLEEAPRFQPQAFEVLTDEKLRMIDDRVADLEAELAPHVDIIPFPISVALRTRDQGKLSFTFEVTQPEGLPSVTLFVPYKGTLRLEDVLDTSDRELRDSPWQPTLVHKACEAIRKHLRSDQGKQISSSLGDAIGSAPWARSFALVRHPVEVPDDWEFWWSLDSLSLRQLSLHARRRSKRDANQWLKLKEIRPGEDHPCLRSMTSTDRALTDIWRLDAFERFHQDGYDRIYQRIYAALVDHPRVCLDGDPLDRLNVRSETLRAALVSSQEGFRLELRMGDRHFTQAELEEADIFDHGFALHDPEEGELLVVEAEPSLMRLVQVIDTGMPLTKEEAPEVLAWLLEREQAIPVSLSRDALLTQDDLEVVLELERNGDAVQASLALRTVFSPELLLPGVGGRFVAGRVDDAVRVFERDEQVEREVLDRFIVEAKRATPPGKDGWLDGLGGGCGMAQLSLEEGLEVLKRAERLKLPVLFKGKRKLAVRPSVGPNALRITVGDGVKAYLLTGELHLEKERIALGALLQAVRRGRNYIEVRPDTFAEINESFRERLAAIAAVSPKSKAKDGAEVYLPAAAGHRLLDLLEVSGQAELSAHLEETRLRVEAARSIRPDTPEGFQAELRPYQREGVAWALRLAALGLGGCLADDMGLGKTVQALAVLLQRSAEGPALVVAPTSVMFNWIRDAARFAPSLDVRLYHGPRRSQELAGLGPNTVLVTSYGVVQRDAAQLGERVFSTLVLDEAHALKSASSATSKSTRKLNFDWVLALTGTPMENHAGELWSLFDLLTPGLLGSRSGFAERFAPCVDPEEDKTRRRNLALAVKPLVLRRTKTQVLPELPPKTEVRVDVVLSKAELELYDAVRAHTLSELLAPNQTPQGGELKLRVLAALTQLRQLACHPRLLEPSSPVASSKHERLLELLDELVSAGRQVLVFSQFVRQLDLVAEKLQERAMAYEQLVGPDALNKRMAAVERFQSGDVPVFLVSLRAGGFGLNLTAADTVIFLDPWWNPAVEAQAADRAHRMGQTRPVTIYRLVARDTLEERVLDLQTAKRQLVEDVLSGTEEAAKLDVDALVSLLS